MLKEAFEPGCKNATERTREQERHRVKQSVIQLRSFQFGEEKDQG